MDEKTNLNTKVVLSSIKLVSILPCMWLIKHFGKTTRNNKKDIELNSLRLIKI